MDYKPRGKAELPIAIIEALIWLIVTPIKWLWKKIKRPG